MTTPSERERVWTVDPYCDSLRERRRKDVGDGMGMFNLRRYWVFDTRESALGFMIIRAEKELQSAHKSLKTAELRLKKCQNLT